MKSFVADRGRMTRGNTGRLAVLVVVSVLSLMQTSAAQLTVMPTDGRNIWRLTSAELNGDGSTREIVGAVFDGRVSAFTGAGQHLWDASTGGFLFGLAAGDLDGDGTDEVAAASADGFVYCFGHDGALRWKYDTGTVVTQVVIARLDGKSPLVVAGGAARKLVVLDAAGSVVRQVDTGSYLGAMRAADFNGDGADEVFCLELAGTPPWSPYMVRLYAGPNLQGRLWDNVRSPYHGIGVAAANLNGDGKAELVLQDGIYRVTDKLERLTPLEDATLPPNTYDFYYRMPLVAVGDLTDDPGPEIAIACGPELVLRNAAGKLLGQVRASQGFTDVLVLPGNPHGTLMLGSSPNGDDNLYRLTFSAGWEQAMTDVPRRGRMERIATNLTRIRETAQRWKGAPADGQPGPFPVEVTYHWIDSPDRLRAVDWAIRTVRQYQRDFPYARLRFMADFAMTENTELLRPDGRPWPRDRRMRYQMSRADMVGVAKKMEEAGVHFLVNVAHGNGPYMELASIQAILEAAPSTCVGFVSAEDPERDIVYFLEHFVRPAMDLCRTHGNKIFILQEKATWWATVPAMPQVRRLLFDGRYRSVLVPSVEDSNSRTPDLNLAARVGLWLDGQVDRWCCRMVSDLFSFNRAWDWEYPMTGHPTLRYSTAHASLGASIFMFQVGQLDRNWRFTRVGNEGVAPFLHLLGQGIIVPPRTEQVRAVSPVALHVTTPSMRTVISGSNGHRMAEFVPEDLIPRTFARMDGYWGMAPTPATDASSYLWGRQRQFGNFIPRTPWGFVAVLPNWAQLAPGTPWTDSWTTDGDVMRHAGKDLSPEEARRQMSAALQASASSLPLTVEGDVFWQAAALDADRLLVTLVDPGWLDPADRLVRITSRMVGRWAAYDRLTDAGLGRMDRPLSLTVPAGTLRVLELHRQP